MAKASIFERGHVLAYTEEVILDALWLQGSEGHRLERQAGNGRRGGGGNVLRQLSIHLSSPATSHCLPCPHTVSSTTQSFPYTEVLFSLRCFSKRKWPFKS